MHVQPITRRTPPKAVLTIGEKISCQLSIITLGSTDQCKEQYDDIPDDCPGQLPCHE